MNFGQIFSKDAGQDEFDPSNEVKEDYDDALQCNDNYTARLIRDSAEAVTEN